MVKSNINKLLYSIPEAATLLGTNADYVRNLVKSGAIRSLKMGRIKIPAEEITSFINNMVGMDITNPFEPKPFNNTKLN